MGDVSAEGRTESKQNQIKLMPETLGGLWIWCRRSLGGYFFGARRVVFCLPATRHEIMAHCEFIFICTSLEKGGTELQENKKSVNPKIPGSIIFTECQGAEQLAFRAVTYLKKCPEPFPK